MSEEVKNENGEERKNVEGVLDDLIEKYGLKGDERFQKVVKMVMYGYIVTKNYAEVCDFLKTQGWDIDDYDVAIEEYMESLFPELNL